MSRGRAVKRVIDFVVAGAGLAVLSPALVAIAALVLVKLGRPILFRQIRPGLHGEPFTLLKFRTMRDAVGPDSLPLPDSERLTRLGLFLRRTSLDELPSLWNVLRGDMSLVGPRPLLMDYLDRYTPQQARRHDVRPGITGLAQINGRQDIPFSKRLELDGQYVEQWSLWLDFKILFKTIRLTFSGGGVRSGQDVRTVDDLGLNRGAKDDRDSTNDASSS